VVGELSRLRARVGGILSRACIPDDTRLTPAHLLKCRRMAEVILLIAAGSFGTLSAAYAAASPEAFGVKEAQ